MTVGAISPNSGISSNPVANGEITKEVFLKLLSTQLQHQNPLEPASDVEFIQQMATFAQLEQQQITNSNLQVMGLYESSINNSNALNIVGKDVKILDTSIAHAEGQSHTFSYEGSDEAAYVRIKVLDDKGQEVYATTYTGSADGEHEFVWQGTTTDGEPVAAGDYKISIQMEDDKGKVFPTQVYQNQRVKGIAYENGSIMLLIGDKRIAIENVIEVYGAGQAGAGSSTDPSDGPGDNPFKNLPVYNQTYRAPYLGQATLNSYQPPFRVLAGGR